MGEGLGLLPSSHDYNHTLVLVTHDVAMCRGDGTVILVITCCEATFAAIDTDL